MCLWVLAHAGHLTGTPLMPEIWRPPRTTITLHNTSMYLPLLQHHTSRASRHLMKYGHPGWLLFLCAKTAISRPHESDCSIGSHLCCGFPPMHLFSRSPRGLHLSILCVTSQKIPSFSATLSLNAFTTIKQLTCHSKACYCYTGLFRWQANLKEYRNP